MGSALCTLFRHKPVKVLYFGLDAAGKTTLLYRMKLGEVVTTIPTIGFNVETVNHNGVDMITWDISTRDKSRALYRHFTHDMDACIFVVDSADHERLTEAVEEFFRLLVPQAENLKVPVLVLANKQDIAGAMPLSKIRQEILQKKPIETDLEVFPTTALTLEGVDVAMDWLTTKLLAKVTRESYLPSLSSASLGKWMNYPASFVKSSYLKVSEFLHPSEQSTADSDSVTSATTQSAK